MNCHFCFRRDGPSGGKISYCLKDISAHNIFFYFPRARLAKVDKKKLSRIRQKSTEDVQNTNGESRQDDSNKYPLLPDVKSLGRLKKVGANSSWVIIR